MSCCPEPSVRTDNLLYVTDPGRTRGRAGEETTGYIKNAEPGVRGMKWGKYRHLRHPIQARAAAFIFIYPLPRGIYHNGVYLPTITLMRGRAPHTWHCPNCIDSHAITLCTGISPPASAPREHLETIIHCSTCARAQTGTSPRLVNRKVSGCWRREPSARRP